VTETADPVVATLTGPCPLLLLGAFVLTWPISVGLLALYKRSVRKSMRTRVLGEPPSTAAPPTGTLPAVSENTAAPHLLLHEQSSVPPGAGTELLFKDLLEQPWRVALVYVLAGLVYALVTTVSLFVATGLEWLPIRFTTLVLIFAWPVVIKSDAVLMDLRGFSTQNSGCIFELHELVAMVPLERVVFIINESTDQRLLSQTLRDAQGGLQSAKQAESESHPVVFKLESMRWRELRRLLLALAIASEPPPARA